MGLQGDVKTQQDLMSSCTGMRSMLHVLDLGPHAHEGLQAPRGWQDVTRHTRQSTWSEDTNWGVGKSRQKQSARFLRDEGTVTVVEHPEAWQDVHALHLASRTRKGLAHHGTKLSALLNRLADQPWTFAVLAHNQEGDCVASGGFVMLPDQTCVYAFGGQVRSKVSGRASVAMLCAAMDEAPARGCTNFLPAVGVGNRGMVSLAAQKPRVPRRWEPSRGQVAADRPQGDLPQGPLQDSLKVRVPAVGAAQSSQPSIDPHYHSSFTGIEGLACDKRKILAYVEIRDKCR